MFKRSRLENLTGAVGLAGVLSGLLTLTMMVGLILALAVTSDPDFRSEQTSADASSRQDKSAPADTAATGAGSGEAGQE